MRKIKFLPVALAAALLAGCATDQGPKQSTGTLLGAIGGAVAGAQFGRGKGRLVGVAAGTLLGALIGSEVGKSLDRADRAYLEQTSQQSLEYGRSGATSTWRNPDSGNYGTITPQPAYRTASNQQCREYTQTITVGGQTETAVGRACRNPDGTWRIVKN